jgi:ELWxxDGT repeat protein
VGIGVFSARVASAAMLATVALVFDVLPVAAAGHPGSDPSGMARVGSQIFFAATTAAHGRELWVTDGTAAGTHEVADINPASGEDGSSWPDQLTAMGNKVYFFAWDGARCGLWKSNGTTAGTKRLGSGKFCEMDGLMNVGGKLMFRSYTGLWVSDGTVRGTRKIANVGRFTRLAAALHGIYYFFGSQSEDVTTLWRSDGTARGTYVAAQMPPDPTGYIPVEMATAGGLLYFRIGDTYPGGATTDLWQSDGTASGTRQVRDFQPEETDDVYSMAKLKGKLYFAVDLGSGPGDIPWRQQLWKTNGTEAGTRLVKGIEITDANPSHEWIEYLTKAGSRLFFMGDDGTGAALWRTRGTARTTVKIAPIDFPTSATDYSTRGAYLDPTPVAVGSRLFFPARSSGSGYELWMSDGSAAGTHVVADINPGRPSSRPSDLAAVGNLLYFSADDGVHGRELWVTDGTEAGTHMILDINPG